jgi:glycosyltransferase involved in cell wall biosynthesis
VPTKIKPLISVVIPTYNHAQFLNRALASIVSQKYSNWEVIVIDNHSTDNTEDVIASFKNSKIKFLKINNNGIIGASRNLGISQARGDWIAFMDSDDVWYDTKLSICIPYCNDENQIFDIISTDEFMVFSNGDKIKTLKHGPDSKNMYRDMILYGNRLSPSATIIRKSFLDKYELKFSEVADFVSAEDYDFWLCLARHKPSFLFLRSVEGEYTIHGANVSRKTEAHLSAIKCVLKKHVYELQEFQSDKDKLWEKVKCRFNLMIAMRKLKTFDFLEGFRLVFMSMISSPLGAIHIIGKKIILMSIAKLR